MPYGFFTVDTPLNEVTHDYRPGSPERKKVEAHDLAENRLKKFLSAPSGRRSAASPP